MGKKIGVPNLLNAIPDTSGGDYLKWGIMGAVGIYLYRLHKQKKLNNNAEGYRVNIDTDKMVDMVGSRVGLGPRRAALAKEVFREFRRGYRRRKKI